MEYDNNWLLSLMVFLPLIGAAVVMLIPKAQEELVKVVALGTTVVTAALGVFMLLRKLEITLTSLHFTASLH